MLLLLDFYCHLLFTYLQPSALLCEIADENHCHRRRYTQAYRRKQRLVRGIWYGVVASMAAFPNPVYVFVGFMVATLLSFCILDESS